MAATFLDIGILTNFQFVFSFVLVWCLVFAILGFTEIFKTAKHLQALISIMVALLTLLSPKLLQVISLIVPWFSILFIFVTLILLGIMMFGIDIKTIAGYVKSGDSSIVQQIVVISFIILIAGLGFVFFSGDATSPNSSTQTNISMVGGTTASGAIDSIGPGALMATLFHPKLLGAIFVLLLGLFTVLLLVK